MAASGNCLFLKKSTDLLGSGNGARPKMQEAGIEPGSGPKQTDDLTTKPNGDRTQLLSGSGFSLKK